MKDNTVSQIESEMADREAIRDCLMRYCRGVDPMDQNLLRQVYWPNATDDLVVGGRYLDFFEKPEDRWEFLDRVMILDWFRLYPNSGEWHQKPLGMDLVPGVRLPDESSQQFFL